jgi:hypothetical protein
VSPGVMINYFFLFEKKGYGGTSCINMGINVDKIEKLEG